MYIGRQVSLSHFNQTWILIDFSKYTETFITLQENPSSGRRFAPFGRADRHDEANSIFSQFCQGAYNVYRSPTTQSSFPITALNVTHREHQTRPKTHQKLKATRITFNASARTVQ